MVDFEKWPDRSIAACLDTQISMGNSDASDHDVVAYDNATVAFINDHASIVLGGNDLCVENEGDELDRIVFVSRVNLYFDVHLVDGLCGRSLVVCARPCQTCLGC